MKPHEIAYYETAATLMPVLYVILLFELRYFGDYWRVWLREDNPDRRAVSLPFAAVAFGFGLLFFIAESTALGALRERDESGAWTVDLALSSMVLLIFLIPMQAYVDVLLHRIPGVPRLLDRISRPDPPSPADTPSETVVRPASRPDGDDDTPESPDRPPDRRPPAP